MKIWVENQENVQTIEELLSIAQLIYRYVEHNYSLEDQIEEMHSLHQFVADSPEIKDVVVEIHPFFKADPPFDW